MQHTLMGACEASTYFLFRIRNFEQLRESFFGVGLDPVVPISRIADEDRESPQAASNLSDAHPLLQPIAVRPEGQKTTSKCSKWKTIAVKTAMAALGLAAQFPFMVLTYYGNGQNLIYPVLTGVCEASFTILSLYQSYNASIKSNIDEPLDQPVEDKRNLLTGQIDRFLEELPIKYNDPVFIQKLDGIFSLDSNKKEDERGRDLLNLVIEARGLPKIREGAWDSTLKNMAKGLGLLISLYVTTVNGAVSYRGVKTWRSEQEALAILTTVFVSLANIKFLGKLCIDSSVAYYEGIRNVITGQYRPPLAHAVSPFAWYLGRALSTVTSWLSFGTTALSARDYIPKAGNGLIAPAPISSALILSHDLDQTSDDILLWAGSKCDPKAARFRHIQNSLLRFKELVAESSPETLGMLLAELPNLRDPAPPTPSLLTPLLSERVSDS